MKNKMIRCSLFLAILSLTGCALIASDGDFECNTSCEEQCWDDGGCVSRCEASKKESCEAPAATPNR